MTRDEAMLAGQLAEAAESLDELRRRVSEEAEHPRDELMSFKVGYNETDAGSDLFSPSIHLPRWAIDDVLAHVDGFLINELAKLGVTP